LGSGADAGAFPAFTCDRLIQSLVLRRAAVFTIEVVIHAAFGEGEDRPTDQLFQFAPEEPPLDLVALVIFYEYF